VKQSDALLCSPRQQLRQGHGAILARHFAGVSEQDQAGDGADAQLAGQLLVGFAVQLGQSAASLQLSGGLLEGRGEAAAWPASAGPDIQQQRQVAFYLLGEIALVHLEGLGDQHRVLAASASRMLANAVGGDAVEPGAVRAGYDERIGHERAPGCFISG